MITQVRLRREKIAVAKGLLDRINPELELDIDSELAIGLNTSSESTTAIKSFHVSAFMLRYDFTFEINSK